MILAKTAPQDVYVNPWWGEYLAQYREAAHLVRGARVLDIGCGWGFGSRYLFDHGALEVVGVDVDPENIREAQVQNGRDGVSFITSDAKNLPFPPRSFEVITCFQVLESTVSAHNIIDQMQRLLVPGGVAVISTVNRKRYAYAAHSPAEPSHIQEFDADELRHLLRKNFSTCLIKGMVCTRQLPGEALLNQFGQNKTLEFVKDRLENRIPWKLRNAVFKKVFGRPYYPSEAEYELRGGQVGEAPLLFAICRL